MAHEIHLNLAVIWTRSCSRFYSRRLWRRAGIHPIRYNYWSCCSALRFCTGVHRDDNFAHTLIRVWCGATCCYRPKSRPPPNAQPYPRTLDSPLGHLRIFVRHTRGPDELLCQHGFHRLATRGPRGGESRHRQERRRRANYVCPQQWRQTVVGSTLHALCARARVRPDRSRMNPIPAY